MLAAVSLTAQEFSLLYVLASHPGIVFSRDALLSRVWKGETFVTDNFVTVCGPVNVASSMPTHASLLYSKNTLSVLQYVIKDGALALNPEDEIVKAMSVKGGAQ